eukprot:gene10097-21037_t
MLTSLRPLLLSMFWASRRQGKERILHNILTLDSKNSFFTGGRPKGTGITPHRHRDSPSVCARRPGGPAAIQRQHELTPGSLCSPKYRTNLTMWTVLPNGLLDVIAEAEVAGEAARDHKAAPDALDCRIMWTTGRRTGPFRSHPHGPTPRAYRIQTKSIGRVWTNKGTASYEDINPSSDEEENKDYESM